MKDLSREEVLTYLENNVVDKQGAAKIKCLHTIRKIECN